MKFHGVFFSFVVAFLCLTQLVEAEHRQPNVILVMTDDQGYGDVGIHGNTVLQTPHLDQLARESVRMSNFHVNPTCSETRAALMTGRYSCRTGVWHTVNGRSLLRQDELTMAEVFASNGYATGLFGKWHLGDNHEFLPLQRGFQTVLRHGGGGIGQTPDVWGNDYFDDTYFYNGQREQQQGYCTDVFFAAAMKFIKANRDRPFFCYVPTNAPHGPFFVPPKYAEPYVEKGVPGEMANFYGMIANIDANMGKLLDKLDEWRLAENTIVIFMTDNGTSAGVLTNKDSPAKWRGHDAGLRGKKGSQYEGGHRVPFFIRWPAGGIEGEREIDALAAQFDLLPTFADLCNLKLPRSVKFDGRSLRTLWQQSEDEDPELKDRTLFVQSQRLEQPQKWRKCAVMTDRWRLVNGKELYDLRADRGQRKDVAAEHPNRVAELRQRYEDWWASVSERFDEPVEISIGGDDTAVVMLTAHDWHATKNRVPWNQKTVETDPEANGYWTVNVQRAGRYEFVLRGRPVGVPFAFKKGEARLKVSEQQQSKPIAAGAGEVTLAMTLPKGSARLQSWITTTEPSRGALFIEVKRLN